MDADQLLLARLDRIENKVDVLIEKDAERRVEIVKSGFWGSIGGGMAFIILFGLEWLLSRHK